MTPEDRAAAIINRWRREPLEPEDWAEVESRIAAAIREAVEQERAACAEVADAIVSGTDWNAEDLRDPESVEGVTGTEIAAAIRARGDA
jgi:hypothetical protein